MIRYIAKRLLLMLPVLLGVVFVVFFIMDLSPVNPAEIILAEGATPESVAALEEELGLNDPFLVRFSNYVFNLLRGDLGLSYKNRLSVSQQIMDYFPNTLILSTASMVIALFLGVTLGIISAKKQNTFTDNAVMILALVGISMPLFWLALLLVLLFAVHLRWLPSSGLDNSSFLNFLRSLTLPAISLATLPTAMITRMTRSSMLEVIRQDYIDTARAKGITEYRVTIKHMLRNALIPIITIAGLQFGSLLSGAILTETVFSWPGIGRLTIDAIKMKDIQVVLGCVVVISLTFSILNLLVDILYAFVDPRIKAQYKRRSIRRRPKGAIES